MLLSIQKTLSPNDMGDTRSHQPGIYVPKRLAHFFPSLNEGELNPRSIVELQSEQGVTSTCDFIHYNNKVVNGGTRDEYQITRIRPFLVACGARTGDTIEFDRIDANRYLVRIVQSEARVVSGTVIVDLTGGWKSVRA